MTASLTCCSSDNIFISLAFLKSVFTVYGIQVGQYFISGSMCYPFSFHFHWVASCQRSLLLSFDCDVLFTPRLLLRFYILSWFFVSVILICLGVIFINESLLYFFWNSWICVFHQFLKIPGIIYSDIVSVSFLFFAYGSQITGMLELFNMSNMFLIPFSIFYTILFSLYTV